MNNPVHLDLFSGIGGFALAAEVVWPGIEHIFCEIDPYCQALLKRRFSGAKIYGDINNLIDKLKEKGIIELCNGNVLNAEKDQRPPVVHTVKYATQSEYWNGGKDISNIIVKHKENGAEKRKKKLLSIMEGNASVVEKIGSSSSPLTINSVGEIKKESNTTPKPGSLLESENSPQIIKSSVITAITQKNITESALTKKEIKVDLLTAGVPCQPASCAGQRRGTKDDRWLWPPTFEVIRITKPKWVILENVRGLLSLEGGLVFESLLSELEAIGYEVQPFIIPAVAVNAPHRRDRVWIVGHAASDGYDGTKDRKSHNQRGNANAQGENKIRESERTDCLRTNAPDSQIRGLPESRETRARRTGFKNKTWDESWYEVALRTCVRGMDDGLPATLDGLKLSKSRHRVERLKALGNSIVPQVAIEIMSAIRQVEEQEEVEKNEYKEFNKPVAQKTTMPELRQR